eukprot:TRINITY_DN6290_c0_g1_i1.p1 TRINITY_DN6290_c0_g1~~TRINITY_DN6290_c0_g1_i1.p1  ORF type:complete len:990 (+),score=381.70 TRINITY_DN6290_c0_g1_i1:71-3040(+)
MVANGLSSVGGIVALLEESQPEIQEFALQKLNSLVDNFWHEIADSIQRIEILYEDEKFRSRQLAALVASKVYYQLEQYPDSVQYALGAGKLFDVSVPSQYVETIVAKCIDEYIQLRQKQATSTDKSEVKIDPRLESVVLSMFERCYHDKKFKHAVGIAFETRSLDKIEEAITRADDPAEMLSYAQSVAMDFLGHREFRRQVLQLLVQIHNKQSSPDYLHAVEILVFLEDPKSVADILLSLISSTEDAKLLVGYQIGFDLVNNATQEFRNEVLKQLPASLTRPVAAPVAAPAESAMDVDTTPPPRPDTPAPIPENAVVPADAPKDPLQNLRLILAGTTSIGLFLDFLFRNNRTDLLILKNMKTTLESRSSVLHSGIVIANALMHSGTTSDQFLRDNLEWLAKATNWSKFSAIAGLGGINKGHLSEAMRLLSPYLPQPGAGSGSPYAEGGSLFALGLINANHGQDVTDYLLTALAGAAGNEIVQHGACLGLGVAAMATGNPKVYDDVRDVMYLDLAVAGEAAALAMGLLMLGSASEKAISEMVAYAHDTQHEKIIRGLAIGLALVMYGREEAADVLIDRLMGDKDAILRYGAMYTIGLAYVGTANNGAIRKLLHAAVSEVSDDVRRAAVMALGFVLIRRPQQCVKMVTLLTESYNPHVRYGAAMALGISCAGTGLREALQLLEPLASDVVDFVRQGALIALSMVLIQATKAQEPKVEQIRALFDEKISDKHEETMCKFGALIASGIIDAGGRNVTISALSQSGHSNMSAIVGLLVFTQYWYWYPLVHFINLSFTPTCVIGLDKSLKLPVMQFKSNARPSTFAYPAAREAPTTVAPEKVKTAVLSVARRKELRDKKSHDKKDAMEIERQASEKKEDTEKKEEKKEEEKEPSPPEPEFELKSNPARVTQAQLRHLSFDVDPRWRPVKTANVWGIVMLQDRQPEQPVTYVNDAAAAAAAASAAAPAAAAAAPAASSEAPASGAPAAFTFDPTQE